MKCEDEYNLVESYILGLGDVEISSGREFSYEYDDETGYHYIRVPPKSRNTESGLIGLLHELGHARSPKSPFKTINSKPYILEREIVAWQTGLKILRKLKLRTFEQSYIQHWHKCWSTYIDKL